MTDPFEVLGLPPDATPSEVRAAHRLAAVGAHAALGVSGSGARMAELNVARDLALATALAAPCRACRGTGRDGAFLCGACCGTKRNPEK